jgi:ABC-type thiamine transport system ATPase subunit
MFNQRQLAQALKEPLDAPFARLTPRMPAEYQPLVSALIQENNQLLLRVRDRAQENQVLLRRSVDMMQQFITAITPHKRAPSGKDGRVLAAEAAGAFYEAIL